MIRKSLTALLAAGLLAGLALAAQAGVVQDNTITGTEINDFEGIVGADTSVDVNLSLAGATYSERFQGQTRSFSGDFDVLTGTPSDPLTLVSGGVGQNVNLVSNTGSFVVSGCGPRVCLNFNAIGEGALSILFDFGTDVFGFDIVGPNGGTGRLQFFARDGSLLDDLTVNLGSTNRAFLGFRATDGDLIAGVSLTNFNGGGVGFDNVVFNQVPELACVGFLPPFDMPLTLKQKVRRAIPVKMQLFDADGFVVTDQDIVAPPVINVTFMGTVYGEVPPDDADLLPLGSANEDNIFRYAADSQQWIYNLSSKQFAAAGIYTVTVTSGDGTEYVIDGSGACSQTFVRLP